MRAPWQALLIASAVSCVPELAPDTGTILEPRILAIRGLPAEARPGQDVRYEALLAYPEGTAGSTSYSYCNLARNAEERTGVSQACLDGAGIVPFGPEPTIPANACALFGPNTPPSGEGEAPRRPSDPDPSGGYFVPILAQDETGVVTASFGFQRVRCDLAGATRDIFEAYEEGYRLNRHPEILQLTAGDVILSNTGQRTVLITATEIRITLSLASFEPYVVYSANDSALYDVRETLRVNWYTSAGEFAASSGSINPETGIARVVFTPPPSFASARLWVVVSDSRGGSAWAEAVVIGQGSEQ